MHDYAAMLVFIDPWHCSRNNYCLAAAVAEVGLPFDNRWVVPYNPYLSLLFNCHINVKVCTSIAVVKYLYKYVCKGHDRA
jgi:hypothetical protein